METKPPPEAFRRCVAGVDGDGGAGCGNLFNYFGEHGSVVIGLDGISVRYRKNQLLEFT